MAAAGATLIRVVPHTVQTAAATARPTETRALNTTITPMACRGDSRSAAIARARLVHPQE